MKIGMYYDLCNSSTKFDVKSAMYGGDYSIYHDSNVSNVFYIFDAGKNETHMMKLHFCTKRN